MEYLEIFKNDLEELSFKCYFSKYNLYLMGTRGLNFCSTEKIIVNLKRKKFFIEGKNLEIEELSKNEIKVKGEIVSLSIIDWGWYEKMQSSNLWAKFRKSHK